MQASLCFSYVALICETRVIRNHCAQSYGFLSMEHDPSFLCSTVLGKHPSLHLVKQVSEDALRPY
jgi:hypothetical protein